MLDLKPKVVSEPERKNQARFPVQGARSPLAVMDLFSTQYNCTDDVIIRIAISLYYSLLIQASVSPKTQVLVQTRRYLQSQSGTLLDCYRYARDCSKWGDITTVREAPAVGTREVARVTGARPCVTGPVVDALTRSSSVTVPTRHHINHHGVGNLAPAGILCAGKKPMPSLCRYAGLSSTAAIAITYVATSIILDS